MAKARGFSAERHDAERRAGCPPELAGVRMDGQHTCEWSGPRLLYPLAACPAERRAPSLGTRRPQATPHGFSARTNSSSLPQGLPGGKGPFTPLPEGRGPLAPGWVGRHLGSESRERHHGRGIACGGMGEPLQHRKSVLGRKLDHRWMGREHLEVTLPLAKAKGLLASGPPASELLARCPRARLGPKLPDTWRHPR